MPKLYLLDEYDRCFEEYPKSGVYCMVDVRIQPNQSSPLWKYIEEFSLDDKRHFRHDHLVRGLCINKCKSMMSRYDYWTKMEYHLKKFPFEPMESYKLHAHPKGTDHRIKYSKILNQCVNYELKRQYALMGYSTVTFCNTATEKQYTSDWNDFTLAIISILVMLTIISTLIDHRLKHIHSNYTHNLNHFNIPIKGAVASKLVAFSVTRNLCLLLKKPTKQFELDLLPFQGIRTLIIFLVIMAHVLLATILAPMANPQMFEKLYHSKLIMIISSGTQVVQTSFTIAAFILGYQFSMAQSARADTKSVDRSWLSLANIFVSTVLSRICRLMPLTMFVLLYRNTLFQQTHNNPMWKRIEGQISFNCQKNWWTNLLFINNYVNAEHMCDPDTWFIATEMQLFIFGTFLMTLIFKYPHCQKLILGAASAMGILIPAVITYVNKLDGTMIATPDFVRFFFNLDPMFLKMYIPMYTNIGSHVGGLVAGIVWFNVSKGNIKLKESKIFLVLWYAAFPGLMVLLLSGHLYNSFAVEKPSIWIAIYATALKNIWALFCSVILLGYATGFGGITRTILANHFTNVIGRLAFCAFFAHVLVIMFFYDGMMVANYISVNILTLRVFAAFTLTVCVAPILYLLVERPASNLVTILFKTSARKTKPKCEMEVKNTSAQDNN